MEHLPKDPAILVSSINMLLRDEEFDALESLCYYFNTTPDEVKAYLAPHGYVYSEEQKQMRPAGYNIPRDCIETAYAFFHQKQRVYQYSTLDWQKDDIEYAIDEYTHTMNGDLYAFLSDGKNDFLRDHTHFASDIISAIERMEKMLE